MRGAFDVLDRSSIPFTVLKGFALAHQVYPSPETRLMNDVDLWMDEAAIRSAMEALAPLGWRVPWWRRRFSEQPGMGEEVGLVLGTTPLLLELHSRPASLLETIPGKLDSFRQRSVPANLGGLPARVLPVEETLIHLSLHLAQHHRFLGGLPRLLDITLVCAAQDPAFDWIALSERCVALGIPGWVATSLATARRLLGAPIPEAALAAFRVDRLDRLTALASEQAWLSGKGGVRSRSVLAAPTLAGRAARILQRIRNVLRPAEGGPGGTIRLLRRLRFAAQITLPSYLRNLRTGNFRGGSGARFRRLSEANAELVEAMARAGPRVKAEALPSR